MNEAYQWEFADAEQKVEYAAYAFEGLVEFLWMNERLEISNAVETFHRELTDNWYDDRFITEQKFSEVYERWYHRLYLHWRTLNYTLSNETTPHDAYFPNYYETTNFWSFIYLVLPELWILINIDFVLRS